MHSYAEHEVIAGEWKDEIQPPHHIETRGTVQERLRRKRMLDLGEGVAEATQWLLTEKFLTLTNEVVSLTHTHKAQPLNVVDKNVKFSSGTGLVVDEGVIQDPEYETEPMRDNCEELVNEAEAEIELPIVKVRV